MKYDYQTLSEFCNERSIILCDDYSVVPLKRETFITGICETENCDKQFTKGFRALLKPNGYCQDCAKKFGKEKAKITSLQKYGVEFTTQSKKVKDKIKEVCLEKYGVEHISQIKEVKNKTKITCLKKYGVEVPSQNNEVKDKIKKTNLKKYGCENYFKTDKCKEKSKATCLKKYGVEHISQNPIIAEKQLKNNYKSKEYIFPSGRVEKIQGYENFALNELLQNNILEEDIVVSRKNVPEIWFLNTNGKKSRYFVDCFIKSQNKCIEVKSIWTLQNKRKEVFLKQQAVKDKGYKCEIWVYDNKGIKIEKYE